MITIFINDEKIVLGFRKNIHLLTILLYVISFYSSSQTKLTLHDSLQAALEKQSVLSASSDTQAKEIKRYAAWIDSAPSISLMHYESDETLGTTESELSINVAIKSPFLREVEHALVSNIEVIRKNAQQQYALYLSGLIRQLVWDITYKEASLKAVTHKHELLSELVVQYKEMANMQAIPQYISLIVQNELNQLALSTIEHQRAIDNLYGQYFRLTGLQVLPDQIAETAIEIASVDLNSHPDVQALDANFKNTHQQLLSASKQTSPWNVQVSGRRVSTANFSENQLGIGVEVPIQIGNNLSNSQQSEYLKLTIEHETSRRKLLHQLHESNIALAQEHKFLLQKQQILNDSLPTLELLKDAMNDLRNVNAPNQEFYIRTLLDTINSQQNVELNQINIQRQVALIRQAAGISL